MSNMFVYCIWPLHKGMSLKGLVYDDDDDDDADNATHLGV